MRYFVANDPQRTRLTQNDLLFFCITESSIIMFTGAQFPFWKVLRNKTLSSGQSERKIYLTRGKCLPLGPVGSILSVFVGRHTQDSSRE